MVQEVRNELKMTFNIHLAAKVTFMIITNCHPLGEFKTNRGFSISPRHQPDFYGSQRRGETCELCTLCNYITCLSKFSSKTWLYNTGREPVITNRLIPLLI